MRTLFYIVSLVLLNSCDDRPDLSDYSNVNDNSSFKFNSTDSTAILFSDNGSTYLKGKLINGKREGVWTEYVRDGNYKSYEYMYKNDIEDGKCYSFTRTGKIQLVGYRKFGTLHGTFVYFDLAGHPEKAEIWQATSPGVSDLIMTKELRQK